MELLILIGLFVALMLGVRKILPRKLSMASRLQLASSSGLFVGIATGVVGALAAWVILPPSRDAECGMNWPCGDPRPPTLEELLLIGAVMAVVMALPAWIPLTVATDLPGWFTLGVALLVNTVNSVLLITGYDYYADPDYDMRHFFASLALWVVVPPFLHSLEPLLDPTEPSGDPVLD